MHAHSIVAYAYNAAMHCPACTKHAYDWLADEDIFDGRDSKHPNAEPGCDQHGIPCDLVDREGNLVTPLFSCAVEQEETCDDCLSIIPGTEQD